MASLPQIQLPVIQNWSCHNCGGCCREHLIEITEEEKRRIEKQRWSEDDAFSPEQPLIQKLGRDSYRLAHQSDGACVFLDENGLCRIHAKFGEPAKPLACRVYPYAYHPAGHQRLTVSLRFSCPSVVQNIGQDLQAQSKDLHDLGVEVTQGKKTDVAPPLIHAAAPHGPQQTEWSDFHRFLKALDDGISDDSVTFVVRLMRILSWLELVEQSQFQTIRGRKLDEFLELVTTAASKAQPDDDLPLQKPSALARMMFRQTVAQYARHDTEAHVKAGLGYRRKLFKTALLYATGWGTVPLLEGSSSVAKAFEQTDEPDTQNPVTFSQLEQPFDGRREELDKLFARYFRVKIQGIHFCGPAHYDTALLDGFRSLALMYPIVMWLARLRASERGRRQVSLIDAQAALATADHNFGYSPALGMRNSLNRIRQLSRMKQLTRLVGWYSQ